MAKTIRTSTEVIKYARENNIQMVDLPGSLFESIQITENNELVRSALGNQVFDSFIRDKKIEWDQYRSQVTDYEIDRYLPTL